MKILSIVGARPQFVKLAPLSREIRRKHDEVIVHTGQHFDVNMSDYFFSDLDIPLPTYNLNVHGGHHGEQTGRMMIALEYILMGENPDVVIVFGDTNSTMAGALVASKLRIPVAHVEAGLRSFNRSMPEEINRILTDHTSDFLFAPTETAVNHLTNEGLLQRTHFTGDIIVDVMKESLDKAKAKSTILAKLELTNIPYTLLTLHRPYTVDDKDKLTSIIEGLGKLPVSIIFPVHPRTRQNITSFNILVPSNIRMIEPQGFLDFMILEANAERIITDSGGIQKEAYILGKPCVTLRSETEWIETVNTGWNILIKNRFHDNWENQVLTFKVPAERPDLFGGHVAGKIVSILEKELS